jgi:ubiquinone/menaquinone biosynthesis C-methylase UbiE
MSETTEQNVKQCCAAFYGGNLARLLLGDTFHPGGTQLTDRLSQLTRLTSDSRVLDVAVGRGTSAFHLARSFGCEVVGVDLSEDSVKLASEEASKRGIAKQVCFHLADAERLPFDANTFDAILCECAFCTFPNKQTAAGEFSRVLKPEGRLGISDLTKAAGELPELDGLLSWIACIGDAKPVELYAETLRLAGLTIETVEDHSYALTEMVRQIQSKLLGAKIMAGLKKIDLPDLNLSDAKRFAQTALSALKDGRLGYVVIGAVKGDGSSPSAQGRAHL